MSWPANPTNGQQAYVNGITYEWNATDSVWNRVFATVNIPDLTTIPTVSFPAQPNITSTGTLSNLTVIGDTVMTGNLTVTGTTEYLNTISLKIQDPVIELGGGANGAPLTTNDNRDRGLVLHYYSTTGSTARDAFIGWDNSTSEFRLASNVSMSGEVATFNTYGNVRGGYFFGDGSQLTGVIGSANYSAYAGNITVSGQPNITSVGTLINTTMGSANSLSGGNLVSATYLTGTLTTGAQPNITSVGAMSLLDVGTINVDYLRPKTGSTIDISGFADLANVNGISFTANSNLSLSGSLSRVYGANLISGAFLTGTLTTNAQPNITSTGTLTSLTVTGLITATIGGIKVGNIQDSTGTNTISVSSGTVGVVGNLSVGTGGVGNISATNVTGTLTTAAQPNITSLGTLVSTTMGPTNSLTGGNLVSASYLTGTLTTAAQPNITAVGNLANLTVNSWFSQGQTTETINNLGAVSGPTVTCNLSTSGTFYHSSVTSGADWTINFTNVPTTTERTIVSTVFVVQGSTAYTPTAVQIDGAAQTVKWASGQLPTGTVNGVDIFTFALIRVSGAWVQVLGTYSGFL